VDEVTQLIGFFLVEDEEVKGQIREGAIRITDEVCERSN